MESVTDFGDKYVPPESEGYPHGAFFSGKTYHIYDALFEGEGGPVYGILDLQPIGVTVMGGWCHIWPLGYIYGTQVQRDIRCRSEEEFNELALKYFGITPPVER